MTYDDGLAQLLQGDALDVMAALPERSVDCVVTSPPYLGLRLYQGEQERVWGNQDCEHEWARVGKSDPVHPAQRRCEQCKKFVPTRWIGNTTVLADCDVCHRQTIYKDATTFGLKAISGPKKDIVMQEATELIQQGQFCQRCGAWRGSFGNEPSVDCGRPKMRLRKDLSVKEQEYVLSELKKRGLI